MLKHYITNALRSFWRFRVTALVNLAGLTLALVCFIATYLFLDALLEERRHGVRQRRPHLRRHRGALDHADRSE